MRFVRIMLSVASLVLVGAQAFGAKTVGFGATVTYNSGATGANSVIVSDLNGDGSPDLIVATNNGVSVLLNDGTGAFLTPTTYATGGSFSNAVALADVNGDGNPDLIVTNECLPSGSLCYGVAVLAGNGDGTFQSYVGYNSGGYETGGLAVGDVDGDGAPDLVLVNNCQLQTCIGGSLTLLLNNGDGTFASATQISDQTGPVAIGDLNGDGFLDLVTAAGTLLGNGNGTFAAPNGSVVGGAISLALADLNGDGILDLVATLPGNKVAAQLGIGDGTFQPAVKYASGGQNPLSVVAADFNGDGFPDLAVANECTSLVLGKCSGDGKVAVLAGNGDGTFQAAVVFTSGGATTTSVAAADLDLDLKTDLVVANACASGATCANGIVGKLINNFLGTVSVQMVSSLNPATLGQPVTFTATVTSAPPIPDGDSVTFTDGTTILGTSLTAGGVATWTTTFSKRGAHSIKATFNGDLYHRTGSRTVSETVNPYPSTTMVTSTPNPSTVGETVTITVTVASTGGPTPTGTVTLKAGTLTLGTVTLSGGAASLSKSNLPQGTDTITAAYHGDTVTAASTGSTNQTVNIE